MSGQTDNEKPVPVVEYVPSNAEVVTLIAFGGMLSLAMLRIAMAIWGDRLIWDFTVEGTLFYWVLCYAVIGTIALIQRRRPA